MTHLLVGSRALEYWDSNFKARKDSDWDIICPEKDCHLYDDFDRVDLSTTNKLDNWYVVQAFDSGVIIELFGQKVTVCNISGLAYLKRSHLARDYNWNKHITQYHHSILREGIGYFRVDLCLERQHMTLKEYGQGNPNLSQSNEDFFDDAVDKKFDHDWIHELVAWEKKPMYTRLKYPTKVDKAWCEKDLWNKLSYEQQLKCVAEETHVIACERFLIPSDWTHNWWGAYMKSLQKVCTTLCSGWFRDFAIDNYPQIVEKFDMSKMRLVKEMTNV